MSHLKNPHSTGRIRRRPGVKRSGNVFSKAQLRKHGELILEHLRNPERPWLNLTSNTLTLNPSFSLHCEYKKAKKIATSPEGTIFEGTKVYWFDCIVGEVISADAKVGMNLEEDSTSTRVSLSRSEAEKLGLKKLLEYFKSTFN